MKHNNSRRNPWSSKIHLGTRQNPRESPRTRGKPKPKPCPESFGAAFLGYSLGGSIKSLPYHIYTFFNPLIAALNPLFPVGSAWLDKATLWWPLMVTFTPQPPFCHFCPFPFPFKAQTNPQTPPGNLIVLLK